MDVQAVLDAISVAENEFAIEVADTDALRREAYRLRYQVYCLERGFEPGDSGEECDEFDANSRHVLLRHASDGEIVGTVRVVSPDVGRLDDSFPMQRVCDAALMRHMPIQRTGEISRFAISKQRRMSCTSNVLLRLALFRGIVQVSGDLGITHWAAVMERSLLRLLAVSAIHFHPVGPLVSYHGIRQPSFGSIQGVLGRIRREQFPVWNYITEGGALYQPQQTHLPIAA